MKEDKYKSVVELVYHFCLSRNKGDIVPWCDIERVMGRSRDDLGGRQIVRRVIRDILQRRHITCLIEPEVGIRMLTDKEAVTKIPTMRQKRAKKQIRKGLKETEYVDRQQLTEREMVNLAVARRAMTEEQKAIAQSIRESEVLLRPRQRVL